MPPRRFSERSKVFCCSKSLFRSLWAVWRSTGFLVPRLRGQSQLGSGGGVHAFSPNLLSPAWPFSSCLHCTSQNCSVPEHSCLPPSQQIGTFTPSVRQLTTTIYCVSHMLCPGQGALYALFRRMQKLGFLHFTESQWRTQRVKGLAQSRTAGERRGRQAPGVSMCPANHTSLLHATPRPGFSITSSIMHVRNLPGFASQITTCYLSD